MAGAALLGLWPGAAGCSGSKPPLTAVQAPQPYQPLKTGYTPGPVAGGGTIRGKVTLTGTAPKLPPVRCARDLDVCDKIPNPTLLVGEGNGVKNVIVSLTDIHAGKAPAKSQPRLEIKHCAYSPRVQAVPVGSSLIAHNVDPIPHDLGASRGDRVFFSRTVLRSEEKIGLSSPAILSLGCDMHGGPGAAAACETGVLGVMENPYFAVTGDDGSFSIGDVPPGSYTLQAWHETLGDQSQRVTVASNGSATADFHFGVKSQ